MSELLSVKVRADIRVGGWPGPRGWWGVPAGCPPAVVSPLSPAAGTRRPPGRGQEAAIRTIPTLLLLVTFLLAGPHLAGAQPGRWVRLSTPVTENIGRLFFIDSTRGWAACDLGVVLITRDGGRSWTVRSTGLPLEMKDIFMVDTLRGWALSHQYYTDTSAWLGTYLSSTSDGGNTWSWKRYQDRYFYTLFFHDSLRGWMAGEHNTIWRTSDGGVTWGSVPRDSTQFPIVSIERIRFYGSQLGVGVGGHVDILGTLWQTTDGGEYWGVTQPSMLTEPLFDLHFWNAQDMIAVGGDYEYGSSVVRTTNGGALWNYTYLGIFGQGRALSFRTPREGYAALGFAATYMVTYDSGFTWRDIVVPDTVAVNDVVFTDSLTGYMGLGRGIIMKYRHPSVSVGEGEPWAHPTHPVLHQNFPNPFNPLTTITFELPEDSRVRLAVVDMLGRELRLLQDGLRPRGLHTVRFDGRELPSGVYLYRLSVAPARGGAPPRTEVRKMVLLR